MFTRADPVFRRCRIYDNQREGIKVWDRAKGTFEACEVFRNAGTGVALESGAAPLLRCRRIYSNRVEGLHSSQNAAGTVEACELWSNTGGIINVWSSTIKEGWAGFRTPKSSATAAAVSTLGTLPG